MPIFDFQCGDCDHTYEQMIRLSDQKPKCPECGSEENQEKKIGFQGFVRTENPDAPKNNRDLAHYLGNGKYMPGYKR